MRLILGCLLILSATVRSERGSSFIVFYGDSIRIQPDESIYVGFNKPISENSIQQFHDRLESSSIAKVIDSIVAYKVRHDLDDWIYYQLIRQTAETISHKADNYERYTLYKWYLLVKSGYASILSFTPEKILLYIQSEEDVFEIPTRRFASKQFVCLNYHDFGTIDFEKEKFKVSEHLPGAEGKSFSYVITKLPDFNSIRYLTKEIDFDYYQRDYPFKIQINPDIQKIFANYPVLNYSYYFNMPMSRVTYSSLIPLLKKYLGRMNQVRGVDFLMHFVRYAFDFEPDRIQFGKEKRLSAEQTLLYDSSDCEDRAAFFFYIVREIYDLPMIVISYPEHVTVAVSLPLKKNNNAIRYKGKDFFICEPSSQSIDLKIGEMLPKWKKQRYEVVHEYKTS